MMSWLKQLKCLVKSFALKLKRGMTLTVKSVFQKCLSTYNSLLVTSISHILPVWLISLKFLLSEGPTASTLIHAEDIIERSRNPSGSSSKLTWAEILKEEPFEGQHWQGAYGLPSGSIADQWEQGSHGSDSSLSPLSDSDYDNREDMYSLSDHDESTDITEQPSAPSSPRLQIGRMPSQEEYFSQMLQMRTFLEKLQKQQYWRQGSSSTSNADRTFDLGDPSTLCM